jgi:hypothetical protein
MDKKMLILVMCSCLALCFGTQMGCSKEEKEHHAEADHQGEAHQDEEGHHHGHHEAHHGGVLNVIGEEAGHIEIRIEDDTLEAWFVGGGNDTDRAVPIKAEEISLTVDSPGQEEKALILKADPMKLAGEELGHCSHYVARADWLRGIETFQAKGEVEFRGIPQEIVIDYPKGYDPMHGSGEHQ